MAARRDRPLWCLRDCSRLATPLTSAKCALAAQPQKCSRCAQAGYLTSRGRRPGPARVHLGGDPCRRGVIGRSRPVSPMPAQPPAPPVQQRRRSGEGLAAQTPFHQPAPSPRDRRPSSIRPEPLEAVGGQLRVSDRVLDVPMPQIMLQCARVLAVIRELEAAGVPQHVRVHRER